MGVHFLSAGMEARVLYILGKHSGIGHRPVLETVIMVSCWTQSLRCEKPGRPSAEPSAAWDTIPNTSIW